MAPTKSTQPKLYQVASSVVVYDDGRRIPLHPGEAVYAASHPLVRRFPDAFKEVVPATGETTPATRKKVEAAVAAPGEVRDVTIPDD
jgi:hypothetical protein